MSVLQLDIEGLGTEFSLRTFDMTSYTFLREICLKSPEHMGQCVCVCVCERVCVWRFM